MRTLERTSIRESQGAGDDWAEQLAQCRRPKPQTDEAPLGNPLLESMAVLWELFDTARLQANDALERAGVLERISLQRTGNERRYVLVGPDGSSRTISIFVNMPVVNGQVFGGVYIGNSQTRQPIFLVPVLQAHKVQWQVESMGIEFDKDLVHDLFLSVFGDDPMATCRLSPLSGFDAFETPWS